LGPLVTLTTDFGLADSYVAEMKAVLLARCPRARVIDVTHQIPPQDVLAASVILERMLRVCPAGTIHVSVVDPGVGTARKLLLAKVADQYVLCPDNGLITWPWRRLPDSRAAHDLNWPPPTPASSTFHGRDILAPAAAALAAGECSASELVGIPVAPILLDVAPATKASDVVIIHIDGFGNAITNLPAELIHGIRLRSVKVGRRVIPVRRTYGDVPPARPLALIGSSGLLEVAVRDGNAARTLRLKVGSRLTIGG
jgi:hypothetical protein